MANGYVEYVAALNSCDSDIQQNVNINGIQL
jgi:hypothetical protein